MELYVLEHRLQVGSIPRGAIAPFTHGLVKLILLRDKTKCKFLSLTRTADEYSIIIDQEGLKELEPLSDQLSLVNSVWYAQNVSAGALGSGPGKASGITKIAKALILPLAEAQVPVFVMSTYQTDFILVQEKDLDTSIECLRSHFKIFREVEGDTIEVPNSGSKGETTPTRGEANSREIGHPLVAPPTRFSVTSLDPDTLPKVATILLDILFYADPSPDGSEADFFSFSIIDGDISLVMDTETLTRFPSNALFTSATGECWKMIKIGAVPLGFDECGIVAQVSEPLAEADISMYYISTYRYDHTLVPEEEMDGVVKVLLSRKAKINGAAAAEAASLSEGKEEEGGGEGGKDKTQSSSTEGMDCSEPPSSSAAQPVEGEETMEQDPTSEPAKTYY
ncbi:cytosolic arginine sensor for mTORC1 subunit 2-like [Branchiostoma floridae x Branchiostoma belcheri]